MTKPFQLKSSWENVKEMMKEVNIHLSDEDLEYEVGKEDELLHRLSQKISGTPEEIRAIIESISCNEGKAS